MKKSEKRLQRFAKEKYPGCHVVFTGPDSAVAISEDGKTHRISRRKKLRIPWVKLANWSVPAVIWFWEAFFVVAFAMELFKL
jgi:hypothetical protein